MPDLDSLVPCPYSEETLAGCRHYRPRSAHGDFPEAGQCTEAFTISGTEHIRHIICRRQSAGALQPTQDEQVVSSLEPNLIGWRQQGRVLRP